MGDLKENGMEMDIGEQDHNGDEEILRRVTQLGEMKEKDGVVQLFVKSDDDSVIKLADIWSAFHHLLESHRMKNEGHVLKTLLGYTAWIVLDGRYSKKVNSTTKSKLTESFRSIANNTTPSNEHTSLGRICNCLIPLSETPWTGSIFKAATSGEPNKEAIEQLWQSEGWILLETRLETIGRIKKMPTMDTMGRILYVCASKGYIWSESELKSTSCGSVDVFDAFRYSVDEYCDVLEACILFWAKGLIDINFLSSISIKLILKTITRLNSRSSSNAQSRLLPRLWIQENVKQLCLKFVNELIPAVIKNKVELNNLTDLYDLWFEMNLESTAEEEHLDRMKSMVKSASMSSESVQSTGCIYSLASFLLSKFGRNPSTRESCVELYVRAMIVDINSIEKYRAEIPLDAAKVQTCCEALASRLIQLSEFFDGCNETSRNLLLTSFSLKPTKELFDALFPPSSAESTDASTSNVDEDLQLPDDLCNDLQTVIFKPRWAALVGRKVKGDELKEICRKLVEEDFSWLSTGRKNAELKYVNVDYEEYSHLPSKYDPNDDGIEKGFTRSGKRKTRREILGKRRIPGIRTANGRIMKMKPMKTMKSSLTSMNRGRNWMKNPGGTQRRTANKIQIQKNVKQKSAGTGKANLTSDSPKVPGKPGRKSRFPEVEEKLKKVSQYLRQIETLKKFLEATESSHPKTALASRAKKLKEQYRLAYCREEKNIPGHVELVPAPNAHKCRARGVYVDSNRVKPTGYIATTSPFNMRLQGVGDFDVEFRLNREILSRKVIDVHRARFKQQQFVRPSNLENMLPETNYARWSNCADDFGVSLTSSDDRATAVSEIAAKHRTTSTKVKRIQELESSQLHQLTAEYNKLKETVYNQLEIESNEAFDEKFPNALEFIVPMPIRANNGTAESSENKSDEHATLPKMAGIHVGDIIEFKVHQKLIQLPPGPKHLQDSVRLNIMLKDATERVRNNLQLKTYQYPFVQSELRATKEQLGQPATLNQETKMDNPRRKRPSACKEFEARVIVDDKTCEDMADSIKISPDNQNSNVIRSLRGRKRKPILHDSLSNLMDIAVGALENKFQRFGKSNSRRNSVVTYKRKKKPQLQDSPSANSSTNCDSNPPDKVPNVAAANTPYVVPKGFSPDEKTLREVTSEEFNEALTNLSLEDKPFKATAASAFGDEFALKVWQLFNLNKNVTEIQAALKCGWNTVNRRINDRAYVEKVVEVLKQHSSRFRERLSALEKEHNDDLTKSADAQNGATADSSAVNGCSKHTELSNGLKSGSAVSEANQSEQEVAKPKFQILFPMLQNASIRKAGELVAKKPLEYPKAPTITKKVLDEQSGMFIDVTVPLNADDEEDPPNIKAALLIPWPDEEEIKDSAADDDHIRQMEEENWKLLDEEPTYPQIEAYETPQVVFDDGSAAETERPETVSDTANEIKIITVLSVPSAQSEPNSQPRKPRVSKRPPRKRKRSDSPENYFEDSSSSSSSSYSVASSSSSDAVVEKARPRSRRTLRKGTVEKKMKAIELDLAMPSADLPHVETEDAERTRLTDLCQRKKVTVVLEQISPEVLLKYKKSGDELEVLSSSPSSPSLPCSPVSVLEGEDASQPEQENAETRVIEEEKQIIVETNLEHVSTDCVNGNASESELPLNGLEDSAQDTTAVEVPFVESNSNLSNIEVCNDIETLLVSQADSSIHDSPLSNSSTIAEDAESIELQSQLLLSPGIPVYAEDDQTDHEQPSELSEAVKVMQPFISPSPSATSVTEYQHDEVTPSPSKIPPTPLKRSSRIQLKDTQLSFKNGVIHKIQKIPTNVDDEKPSTSAAVGSGLRSISADDQLRTKTPNRTRSTGREANKATPSARSNGTSNKRKRSTSRSKRRAIRSGVSSKSKKRRVTRIASKSKPNDVDEDEEEAEDSSQDDADDDYCPSDSENDFVPSEEESPEFEPLNGIKYLKKSAAVEKSFPKPNGFHLTSANGITDHFTHSSLPSSSKLPQTCPIIKPIEVNVSNKKKIKSQPFIKSSVIPKDPLRSSYSPPTERLIEEIQLSSDSESEVMELPCEQLNNLPQHSASLMQISLEEEEAENSDEEFQPATCRYNLSDSPNQEETLRLVEDDDGNNYRITDEINVSIIGPMEHNNSPEMILGLNEDSSISYTDHARHQEYDDYVEALNTTTESDMLVSEEESCHLEESDYAESSQQSLNASELLQPALSSMNHSHAEVFSSQEPTPPLLTPENEVNVPEEVEYLETFNEPASPPRLLKFDVGDVRD